MRKAKPQPFDAYLREIEARLSGISAAQRDEIRRELIAHLEDAAVEYGREPGDPELQRIVIAELGPSAALGAAFARVEYAALGVSRSYRIAKRLLDIGLAMFYLLLLAPFMLAIVLLIRLDTPGPILYRDQRIGRDGRLFWMLKFRSMYVEGRPGYTRVGRILRNAQLDELPQLFNVLKGDMSLIGPRPARQAEVDFDNPSWQVILSVQPGVSGLAQLVHGQGYEVAQRLRLDLQYIQHRSVRLDLRLLLQTLRTLLRQATSAA